MKSIIFWVTVDIYWVMQTWVLKKLLRFLCLFIKSTTVTWRGRWLLTWMWRGNFGNEIIKQYEKDNFLGNSRHILGYGKLGYEKAIRPKWAGQNTVFPKENGGRVKGSFFGEEREE